MHLLYPTTTNRITTCLRLTVLLHRRMLVPSTSWRLIPSRCYGTSRCRQSTSSSRPAGSSSSISRMSRNLTYRRLSACNSSSVPRCVTLICRKTYLYRRALRYRRCTVCRRMWVLLRVEATQLSRRAHPHHLLFTAPAILEPFRIAHCLRYPRTRPSHISILECALHPHLQFTALADDGQRTSQSQV